MADTAPSSFSQRIPFLRGLPSDVGVLAAIAFCVALGFGIVAPALPVFARTFGVSAFLATAVISAFAFMRLIASAPAGALVNRIGERVVLTSGLVIVALSSFVAGFSQDYVQLLVLRGVGGIGSSMFTVAAMALLLRTTGPNQRGKAASAFQAGFLFGGITGPAIGGLVVGISIRAPFFVYAGALALAAIVAFFYLKSPQQIEADRLAADGADAATVAEIANTEDEVRPVSIGVALRNGAYRAALAANLVNGVVTFGIRTSLVPLFVVESLLRGPGLAGIGFLVAAATQAASLLPAGRVTDNRGRKPALLIGMVATLVGAAMLAFSAEPILFVAAMAVMGAGTAFLSSTPPAIVGDVMGKAKGGTVVAVFQMVADVGAIAGPLLAGFLADQLGYHWAFASAVVIVAGGLVIALLMPETRKASADRPTETAAP